MEEIEDIHLYEIALGPIRVLIASVALKNGCR